MSKFEILLQCFLKEFSYLNISCLYQMHTYFKVIRHLLTPAFNSFYHYPMASLLGSLCPMYGWIFYTVLKQQQLNNDSYEISFMLFKDLPSLLERRSIATETLLSIATLHIHMCSYTTFLLINFNFYLKYFSHTTNESYILFLVENIFL